MIVRVCLLLVAVVALATCAAGRTDGKNGRVCAAGIIGAPLDPISGPILGCGLSKPVKVVSVGGISLSRPAIMDCATAKALKSWVNGAVKPGFAKQDATVTKMVVYDDYNCRTRNNRPGAKLSFHAQGRAIDIGEFVLSNGERVTVLSDWRSSEWGKTLQGLHRAACGPFKTVLGPNHDSLHRNHFHLDTAQGFGRTYCR